MDSFHIHSAYDVPGDPGITFTLPTMAQQHLGNEGCIRTIMAKYRATGELPTLIANFGYADVSSLPTYQEALNMVCDAQEQFMELPSDLRKYFNNDPGEFLDFLNNPDNHPEAVRLGLVDPVSELDTPKGVQEASASSPLDVTGTTDSEPK